MKSTVIKYRELTNEKTAIEADPGRKRDPRNLTFARAYRTKQTDFGAFRQDLEDFNYGI